MSYDIRPNNIPVVGKLWGPTDAEKQAQAEKQATFARNAQELGGLSNQMDARRKAALAQSMAFFDPVNGLLDKMYGSGASGPGIDIDALFGSSSDPSAAGAGAAGRALTGNDLLRQFYSGKHAAPDNWGKDAFARNAGPTLARSGPSQPRPAGPPINGFWYGGPTGR